MPKKILEKSTLGFYWMGLRNFIIQNLMNKKNIKKDIIPKESSNSNVELSQKEINSNEQPNRTNPDNYNLTVVLANLS